MSDYESDYESDLEGFEALEYDEARRRRRRRRRRRQPVPPPAPRPGPATTARLANAVNNVNDDVVAVESRLAKVNSDVSRLKQLALISLILPRGQTQTVRRISVEVPNEGAPRLAVQDNPQGAPAAGQVDVVTNVASKVDILPILLFTMLSRGIGAPTRAGAAAAAGNDMMPILLIALLPQLQGGSTTGTTQAAGGLDVTTLLVLTMVMGGGGFA